MTEVADQFTEERAGETTRITNWIDGQPVEGTSGRSGPVYNPATGVQSGEVDFATAEEVDAAVQAARRAFESWRTMSLSKRTELYFGIRELFHQHGDDLARLLTLEHGKVLSDAKGEIARGLEVIEYCCGIPELLTGSYSEQAPSGIYVYSIRQPLGVVAGITPFNFPAMVPMWMWAPAIACGNTFVLKPSEKDPSASMLTAELLKEAGLPDGVFNVVHGDKVAVDAVLEHPEIAAVSFVGSTPIARYVYETGTKAGKRVQALGGAKNHMIVLPDADIEMTADAAVGAGYGSAGERCMAVSMLVAVGHAADDLVGAIQEALAQGEGGHGPGAAAEGEGRQRPGAGLGDGPARHARAPRQGRLLHREGQRGRREGAHRRPRDGARRQRRLPRRRAAGRGHAGDGRLQGRDLRARARAHARGHLRGGRAPGEREPVRQRRRDLHARRRRRPAVQVRGERGHGRRHRPDPGAGRLLLVRRLEELALRRP